MDGFLDLPRQFRRDLTWKENSEQAISPVGPGGSTLIKKLQNKESRTSVSPKNVNYPECNGPFPSCCKPHYKSEAKYKAFHINISFVCI